MFSMFGGIIDKIEEVASDSIGSAVDTASHPVRDRVEIFKGLTEGEIRALVSLKLGVDVVSGMTFGEIIEWQNNN